MRSLILTTGKVIKFPDIPVRKKKSKPYGKLVFVRNHPNEDWKSRYLQNILKEKEKPYIVSKSLSESVWDWEAFKYCQIDDTRE